MQQEAIASIKNKKGAEKRGKGKSKGRKWKSKGKKGSDDDDSDDSDYSDDLGMYKKSVKLPGQLENCEICGKRFTVTPYSKAGPDGGLLCTPCGKQLAAELGENSRPKKKPGVQGRKRRKIESERLDGRAPLGAKSLTQLCIEKVVRHSDELDDLGDLPQSLLERLGEIFTKKRVLKPKTLPLFLRSDHDAVVIHDCAYLEHDNFVEMIAKTPQLERLVLGNACQFKDGTMQYLTEKAKNLKHVQLYAANLVSGSSWSSFFKTRGENLETVKLQWLDSSFEDANIAEIVSCCPNLSRLKLEHCRRLTESCLEYIMQMAGSLRHLSLQFSTPVSNQTLISLLEELGSSLQTLSLASFPDIDDEVLSTIHSCCGKLSKLRITDNDTCTDEGFARLFDGWANPPLRFLDLSSNRDVDNNNPDGPEEAIGFASSAFAALMRHSGERLEHLSIASCRHISYETLAEVFDGNTIYPELRDIDLSFVGAVDTPILAGLFKAAPNLRKVIAFGCFGIEDLVVPAGIIVIGVPKAQDAIEKVGETVDVDGALSQMAAMVEGGLPSLEKAVRGVVDVSA